MFELIHTIEGDTKAVQVFEAKTAHIDLLVREAVEDIAAYAAQAAQGFVNKRTGNLAQNIVSSRATRSATGGWEATAGVRRTAPYAEFVERGTGIFGPKGTPIVPLTGNFLVFWMHGKKIYARSVKGQRPQLYMERAYHLTNTIYVPQRLKLLKAEAEAL